MWRQGRWWWRHTPPPTAIDPLNIKNGSISSVKCLSRKKNKKRKNKEECDVDKILQAVGINNKGFFFGFQFLESYLLRTRLRLLPFSVTVRVEKDIERRISYIYVLSVSVVKVLKTTKLREKIWREQNIQQSMNQLIFLYKKDFK